MSRIDWNWDWDEEYPAGFLSCYSSRRMAKDFHRRMKMVAAYKQTTLERVFVKALEKGIAILEMEVFTEED